MESLDPRDARIAELERLLGAALVRIEALEQRNAELQARVAELEAQLHATSRNSSKPPSSDPPGTPPRRQAPTGRKPGGQPGHKGTKRELLAPDKVTEVVVVPAPARCTCCSGTLLRLADAPPARVHQVVELPRLVPHVTQYELHAGWCAGCDVWRAAPLPPGVPEGNFGPRLTAFIALVRVPDHGEHRFWPMPSIHSGHAERGGRRASVCGPRVSTRRRNPNCPLPSIGGMARLSRAAPLGSCAAKARPRA